MRWSPPRLLALKGFLWPISPLNNNLHLSMRSSAMLLPVPALLPLSLLLPFKMGCILLPWHSLPLISLLEGKKAIELMIDQNHRADWPPPGKKQGKLWWEDEDLGHVSLFLPPFEGESHVAGWGLRWVPALETLKVNGITEHQWDWLFENLIRCYYDTS